MLSETYCWCDATCEMYFYFCRNEQVATASMEAIEKLAGSQKGMVKTDQCATNLEIKLVIIY